MGFYTHLSQIGIVLMQKTIFEAKNDYSISQHKIWF